MTNQQGAPEALPDPSPDQLRAIARYKIGYAADSWGTRSSTPSGIPDHAGAWVRYEDHLAALVEAQQPAAHVQNPAEIEHVAGNVSKNWPESNTARQAAPSAAEPCANCGEDKNRHNGLRCVSGAENAYFAPQADSTPAEGTWTPEMVAKMQAMAAALPRIGGEPAPQADSQPAWASQAVIEYRYAGGTHWCPLGPAERMKPNFDGVYRLQGGVFPVEAPADSVTAPAGGVVVGPGWRLVPVESTAPMQWAFERAETTYKDGIGRRQAMGYTQAFEARYRAMLAAAPTPPAQAADSVLEDAARWFAERDNVLHSFWVLLGEVETLADNDNNPLLKHQVEGFYRQWNALNGSALEPRWVTRAARKQGGA